jgi:FkbM family methyltransferase
MRINGEFRFLSAHAPACHILFDVGAYHGGWTRHALRVNPRAEVHCFEPVRAHYEQLVALGLPPQVTCNAIALSDAIGMAEIFTRSLSLHDRRGPGFDGADDTTESVERTTLECYCAGRGIMEIDLLKIDTEGHDLAVLRGGARMIREGRIRRIQFEYGPRNVFARVFLRDFFVFFAGLPYRLYQVMPRRLAPVPAYDRRLENLQYKNFVALHDSVPA